MAEVVVSIQDQIKGLETSIQAPENAPIVEKLKEKLAELKAQLPPAASTASAPKAKTAAKKPAKATTKAVKKPTAKVEKSPVPKEEHPIGDDNPFKIKIAQAEAAIASPATKPADKIKFEKLLADYTANAQKHERKIRQPKTVTNAQLEKEIKAKKKAEPTEPKPPVAAKKPAAKEKVVEEEQDPIEVHFEGTLYIVAENKGKFKSWLEKNANKK